MWRPAVWRFGVCSLALVACWSDKPAPAPTMLGNRSAALATPHDLTGAYWCSIEDGGYAYPQFPCAIRKVEDQFVLAKLAGSQRFHGVITPDGAGFAFAGEFYCPYGDCTQPLHGAFEPAEHGELRGTFRDANLIVRLVPAPTTAFGGAQYGGDGYGGFGDVGGIGYGGVDDGTAATTGHSRRPIRRNRRP